MLLAAVHVHVVAVFGLLRHLLRVRLVDVVVTILADFSARFLGEVPAAEGGVPVVLDGIVRAAGKEASYGGPLVAVQCVRVDDGGVLRGCEGAVLHMGAQLVAPSEAAGFARPPVDAFTDQRPVASAVLLDEALQRDVLLWTPWPLDAVDDFLAATTPGGCQFHARRATRHHLPLPRADRHPPTGCTRTPPRSSPLASQWCSWAAGSADHVGR